MVGIFVCYTWGHLNFEKHCTPCGHLFFYLLYFTDFSFVLQEDERFLTEVMNLLTDEATSDAKRRDLMLFLREFCNYSQNLQPPGKETFYKILSTLGILPALEITLGIDDPLTKSASVDVLSYIVEYSSSVVREYTLQQANSTDEVCVSCVLFFSGSELDFIHSPHCRRQIEMRLVGESCFNSALIRNNTLEKLKDFSNLFRICFEKKNERNLWK